MATLVLRNIKGSPLSNTEVDNNFQNLNNALGAAGSTTIPTPTGTGSPVLSTAPTISTNLFGGTQANTTRFPYAFASISSVTGGVDETTTYIGLISEAKGSGSYNGVGLYGVGYATGALRGTGVQGEGHVSLTGDTASAIGIRGYSNDTHSGGMNVGLFGDASGSTVGNYALYMNSGDIGSSGSQSWILGGNLSFTGAFSVTIPTLNVTTITGAHNGTVGATSPNTGAFTNLSYTGTLTGSTGIMNIGSGQIYKDAAGNVGIGTSSPLVKLAIDSTDAILIPKGSTEQRPTGSSGYIRFNTTLTQFEGHNGTAWGTIGGGGATITDDSTTNSSFYPVFTTVTSGTMSAASVSSTKMYFNPSTGVLSATLFNSLSDANYKTNVVPVTNGLSVVKAVEAVEFDWIDGGAHSSGVIAQQLETVLPFLVDTTEDGKKSVNYSGLIAYLIGAVKELSDKVEELENR